MQRRKRATLAKSSPNELAEQFLVLRGIQATSKQFDELAKLYAHFQKYKESRIKKQAAFKNVAKMIENGVDSFFVRRLLRSVQMGKGITLKKMLVLYSRKGYDIWDDYVTAQSATNTFEYKNEKYGMTLEEFNEYNKSRSQTKENMIRRYGAEEGERKWNAYVERQRYAGVTIEYYVEKYGAEEGKKKYEEVNRLKAHTIESIMSRDNCSLEDAIIRKKEIFSSSGGYSKISQEFCWSLYNSMVDELKDSCYFAELNKEYSLYDHVSRGSMYYDFVVDGPIKLAIEFHGDYYHDNPRMYSSDFKGFFYNKNLTAEEVWARDAQKEKAIIDNGFRYIVVWESDYREDPQREIKRCLDEISRAYEV